MRGYDLIKSVSLPLMKAKKPSYFLICKSRDRLTHSSTERLKLHQWIVFKAEKRTLFCSRVSDLTSHLVSDF